MNVKGGEGSGKEVVYKRPLLSQECYWAGKSTKEHDRSSHYMEEYCIAVSLYCCKCPIIVLL